MVGIWHRIKYIRHYGFIYTIKFIDNDYLCFIIYSYLWPYGNAFRQINMYIPTIFYLHSRQSSIVVNAGLDLFAELNKDVYCLQIVADLI